MALILPSAGSGFVPAVTAQGASRRAGDGFVERLTSGLSAWRCLRERRGGSSLRESEQIVRLVFHALLSQSHQVRASGRVRELDHGLKDAGLS